MKLELLFIAVTVFFVYNTYYDGKYMKLLLSWKKYFQIGFYILLAIVLYLLIKRNPEKTKTLLYHTNNMVKTLPIDTSGFDMLTPIFDFTESGNGMMQEISGTNNISGAISGGGSITGGMQSTTKRCVSETKKKYVGSSQNWQCGNCKSKLTHTFEIDHIVSLKNGGTNETSNLIALCPSCHRDKTAFENMK